MNADKLTHVMGWRYISEARLTEKCVIRTHFGLSLSGVFACDFHFWSEIKLTCQYHGMHSEQPWPNRSC